MVYVPAPLTRGKSLTKYRENYAVLLELTLIDELQRATFFQIHDDVVRCPVTPGGGHFEDAALHGRLDIFARAN